ncbi:NAD-dependent epimerase/dehydratase family protein [Paraburkholderia dipogonis]|uniref:NAD-dependent epimerase/dehydratase family protein n=1 Tax=Paraburkholderia dipogonis TaxID=1211383 RepID=A0A4Y8MKY4_9BURK|nr:NAD(P)H-binding protein [Paraburkholderia dipogonis]TFE38075.1 NAD-dependent epimerase/dehydratase family protein [Paraburkholderia dipogonis]
MSNQKIAILGGTGYSGSNIAHEATRRGYTVTAVARTAPKDALAGVTYVQGSIADEALLNKLAADHDVLVVAIRAIDGVLHASLPALTRAAIAGKARVGHVSGASSSLVAKGGTRLLDTPEFPVAYKVEASTCADVLDWFRSKSPAELDWFSVTPPAGYTPTNPGQGLGRYRRGGDQLVTDGHGLSYISGADLALAFVDEIATPTLHRARVTIGY